MTMDSPKENELQNVLHILQSRLIGIIGREYSVLCRNFTVEKLSF